MLTAARLTVVYGASGVGKSSVLRAGVVQTLREQSLAGSGFAIALYADWSVDDPIEALAETVRDAVADVIGSVPDDPGGPLAERFAAWCDLLDGDLYLVLDQVDEYFLYHPAGPLLDEFPALVSEPGLRVNALLGVREDALASLDVFKADVPALFRNYFRLEPLGREAGRNAIVGPLEQWSRFERRTPRRDRAGAGRRPPRRGRGRAHRARIRRTGRRRGAGLPADRARAHLGRGAGGRL